ncbi:MAG: beta-lactamase family protein [Chloroflexia bacterium]|nr:beta-lactamase family protein [Chloroflexia bacterium]
MQADVEGRIKRVVEGLLFETARDKHYGGPASLEQRMAHYSTPGASIAVVNNGEIEWVRSFGVRAWGWPAQVMPETLFQAGSVSKPIFALAVMHLVQGGRLDLDEDVNHYLSSWQVPTQGDWQPRITLRQILSHSAGLTVSGFLGSTRAEIPPTLVQVLNGQPPATTPPIEVNILPGLQFRYSGGGTTVAQQVLVDVLGQPFPEIMRRLVLEPLGMSRSTYEQPLPKTRWGEAATGHLWKCQPVEGDWHVYPQMAAAGLWTTASDLARAGIALQHILGGVDDGLLSADTVREMLRPQVAPHMGLGFMLGKDASRFGHGGWNHGFVARMTMCKEFGLGVVVMLNSNQGEELLAEIERAVAQEYDWPDYFAEETLGEWPKGNLLACTGVYKTSSGQQFSVGWDGAALFLQPEGQPRLLLSPISASKFAVQGLNTTVQIELTADGSVVALIVLQEGQVTRAPRRVVEKDKEKDL